MHLKKIIVSVFLGIASYNVQGQVLDSLTIDVRTIDGQFTEMITKSNNWEQYKVVPKQKLYLLKKNVQDSLNLQKKSISEKNTVISENHSKIKDLEGKIEELQTSLNQIQEQRDSVSFLGMLLDKSVYSMLVWGIILGLLSFLGFYVYRFSKSNAITQQSIKDLEELQNEYEDYRSKSIEREQKVRRQLQDEINKNRGV